jgi:hypothetical protein
LAYGCERSTCLSRYATSQQFRLTEAIRAYQEGQVDVGQAAEQAHLPIAVFLEEMATQKVAVLEGPKTFGPGLVALREAFGQEEAVEPEAQ